MSKSARRARMEARANTGLARFPMVSDRDHREGRSYEALWDRWRDAPMQPLKITAQLATGHIATSGGRLYLDGILAAGLQSSRLVGPTAAERDADYCVPLPLMLAWVSAGRMPLWAATELVSEGVETTGQAYLHKRHPTDRAALGVRMTVNTSAGKYKDVRMPLPVRLSDRLSAWCLGIEDDLRAILSSVTHIGRKGAIGYGRVLRWTVEPASVSLAWIMARRNVPLTALGDEAVPASLMRPRDSWTPPHWDARHHAPVRVAQWTA